MMQVHAVMIKFEGSVNHRWLDSLFVKLDNANERIMQIKGVWEAMGVGGRVWVMGISLEDGALAPEVEPAPQVEQ